MIFSPQKHIASTTNTTMMYKHPRFDLDFCQTAADVEKCCKVELHLSALKKKKSHKILLKIQEMYGMKAATHFWKAVHAHKI